MTAGIILLIMAVAVIGMAKRRRRRWNSNNQVVAIAAENGITTVIDQGVAALGLTIAADEEYRAISLNARWSIRDHTPGEGPIMVGLSHGDYTAAEIKEFIEATGMMTRGNLIAHEQGNRRCRRIGTFAGVLAEETLNDGKPIRTKINWHIPVGKTLNSWAYNQSGATLTTGTVVVTQGTMFMRWGQ